MPSAAKSGALLGVVYELHSNARLNRSFCGMRCVLTMIAGAVVAKTVSQWDRNAELGKEADKERKEMHDNSGSAPDLEVDAGAVYREAAQLYKEADREIREIREMREAVDRERRALDRERREMRMRFDSGKFSTGS